MEVAQRGYIRTQISKLYALIPNIPTNSIKDNDFIKSKIVELEPKLNNFNEKIFKNLYTIQPVDDTAVNTELAGCENYSDMIIALNVELKSVNTSTQNTNTNTLGRESKARLKGPSVPLPTYSASESESLEKFFYAFETALDKYDLSSFETFILLKDQCSGRALVIINALEIHKQNYESAKDLLHRAFAAPEMQIASALNKLFSLNCSQEKDPYVFVSEYSTIRDTLKTLNVTIENVISHCIWKAMNKNLQTHFRNITNKNYPDLKEIDTDIFNVIQRYLSGKPQQPNKTEKTTASTVYSSAAERPKNSQPYRNIGNTSHAANFKYDYIPCVLCSTKKQADHPVYKCDRYTTPKAKISQLKIMNLCTVCTKNHTGRCEFWFKQKCECNAWHYRFLCDKTNPTTEYKKPSSEHNKPETSKTTSSIVEVGLNAYKCDGQTILPTCTGQINGKNLTFMCDTGSQLNFCTSDLAKKLNFKILQTNYPITIYGFNQKQEHKAKLIEVAVKFNSKIYTIKVVSVNKLNIHIKVPSLGKVVNLFESKGFELADKKLNKNSVEVEKIDFILGITDFIRILEPKTVNFGSSSYMDTPAGVVLLGDPQRILKNSKSLTNDQTTVFVSNVTDETVTDLDITNATDEMLNKHSKTILSSDDDKTEDTVEKNEELINYVLENTYINDEGRICMPLMWNKMSHLLPKNLYLSQKILSSNLKKFGKNPEHLKLCDEAVKKQIDLGIIEKIDNYDQFSKNNPSHSFVGISFVIKPDKATTKARLIYLANLAEKNPRTSLPVNHCTAISPGPNLNNKIFTAWTQLRFGRYIVLYDLQRAFYNICMQESSVNRWLIHWAKNIEKNDLTPIVYRLKRLPMGCPSSPCLLMLALYKILVLDCQHEDLEEREFKKLLYSLFYVDNGGYTCDNPDLIESAIAKIISIFNSYKFGVQQWVTNVEKVQEKMDSSSGEETPEILPLLGMRFNRISGEISCAQLHLDPAADTPRKILQSLNKNYDIINLNLPLLNRAKLFVQEIQSLGPSPSSPLKWDNPISQEKLTEWGNIARQLNAAPQLKIDRFIGEKDHNYKLVGFTDASKQIAATVIYIVNLTTNTTHFILSKNKLLNTNLKLKTIPTLELYALYIGTETILEVHKELCGATAVNPIKIESIEIFSDSSISLHWLNLQVNKLKLPSKNIFVTNKLNKIEKICEQNPITYAFISGFSNPADVVSRPTSYSKLTKTEYLSGPAFLTNLKSQEPFELKVTIPTQNYVNVNMAVENTEVTAKNDHLIPIDRFSSFRKLRNVTALILKFVSILKSRICPGSAESKDHNFYNQAEKLILLREQREKFPDVFKYLTTKNSTIVDMPSIVGQLNVYIGEDKLLRVKGKCERSKKFHAPILLPKNSVLTNKLIRSVHCRNAHIPKYTVLNELRKKYYIPRIYTLVKNILRTCVICRRFNQKSIPLNQSPYREFRIDPSTIPYKSCFIDHLGPIYVYNNNKEKTKIWILAITCLFSRHVDLKICHKLDVESWIRAFQLHCFEYGTAETVYSDQGSQLTSGGSMIEDWIKDPETQKYLKSYNIKSLKFSQYFTGNSSLGSTVETLIKQIKKLLFGSIKNNVLSILDLEYIVCQTVHLINRRPIALKEALRDGDVDIPEVVTPEFIVRGYHLPSINLIPELESPPEGPDDPDWVDPSNKNKLFDKVEKLRKIRENIISYYNNEFQKTLLDQSTNLKNRYKPVSHVALKLGDIVLIKEKLSKACDYPMAVVTKVQTNESGEVTGAIVKKGRTMEFVKRHINSLLLLYRPEKTYMYKTELSDVSVVSESSDDPENKNSDIRVQRTQKNVSVRNAADKCKKALHDLAHHGLV